MDLQQELIRKFGLECEIRKSLKVFEGEAGLEERSGH